MAELDGRRVYTRAELMALHSLSRSTLERWHRERHHNGHPEAAGTLDRRLVWDSESWDAWFAAREDARGLATLAELAERVGRSVRTLEALYGARTSNGHPAPRKRVARSLWWDVQEYEEWFRTVYEPSRSVSAPSGNRAGAADDLITLAEAARVLGVEPTSITMYPTRPPAGWPAPAEERLLPSGRRWRRYLRGDIWRYDDHRPIRGRRPAAP